MVNVALIFGWVTPHLFLFTIWLIARCVGRALVLFYFCPSSLSSYNVVHNAGLVSSVGPRVRRLGGGGCAGRRVFHEDDADTGCNEYVWWLEADG